MSGAESRPLPLRVPVAEVAVRSSIVGQRRTRESLNSGMNVVQRAVRIISDPPPAAPPSASDADELPTIAPSEPAPTNGANGAAIAHGAAVAHGVTKPAVQPAPLELEEEIGADPEQLDDEHDGFGDDDDEDDDGELLEVSVPPPAPPEALRRSPSTPTAEAVSAEANLRSRAEERASTKLSGADSVEELDLDFETRVEPSTLPTRLPSPPPPPKLRPSIPALPAIPEPSPLTQTARVQELRPTKPRAHAWWEVFFDDDYLRTVRPPTREQIGTQCDFIEKRLGLKPGASVLDVGCGLGLHVIELTARGYTSVGVDLSLAMLARAAEEAQARGVRINFLHADMRDLTFEASFDAVTCLGTSLGYFDDETNRKVLERLLRALKPGGVLLLDVVNRDHVIRSQPNLIWFEGDGCVCMEESEFNYFTSRLHIKRTVILDIGRQLEHEYSLRLYSLHEIGQLMNTSGFRVSEVSGRSALPGVFFGQESPNLMIVAQRRPDGGTHSDDRS
jgi:SAM-dependent methyltransferase